MADRVRVSPEGAAESGSRRHECRKCREPLERAWTFCPACGERAPGLRTGEILDERYEILDLLARHGAREVYRARHLHLDEPRVVKILNGDLFSDDSQVFRFRQEAKLSSRLRHPNVATLHDFSSLGGGTFYTAWEFLEGETAADRLRRMGPFAEEQALDVAAQVANGLAAIHAAGVVHRSISPQNIMLLPERGATREGGSDRAKIIDFGIATALAASDSEEALRRGYVDERYAAPEQIEVADGKKRPVDERADLYSLGVTLFELLTGRLPEDRGERPPSVSDRVWRILTRAVEKDPERRYRSAAELRDALIDARRRPETAPAVSATVPFVSPVESPIPAPVLTPEPVVVPPVVAPVTRPAGKQEVADWSTLRQPEETVPTTTQTRGGLQSVRVPPKMFWLAPLLLLVAMAAFALWRATRPSVEQPAAETVTAPAATSSPSVPAPATATVPMVLPPNVEGADSAMIVEEDGTPVQSITMPANIEEGPAAAAEENGRVTASEASNLLLNGLRARQYYKVPANCVRVGDVRYINQGYTIEVRTRSCPDTRIRAGSLLGRWRVDARTGELYVQNARGKYVDP